MRIKRLNLLEFRNHRSTTVELPSDEKAKINVFVGRNNSGKSSLIGAVEYALTGRTSWTTGNRTGTLIRSGAEEASVEVELAEFGTLRRTVSEGGNKVELNRHTLPIKTSEKELEERFGISPDSLRCVIDGSEFFRMDTTEKMNFLFRMGMGKTPLSPETVVGLMDAPTEAAKNLVLANLPSPVMATDIDAAYKVFFNARSAAKKLRDEIAGQLKHLREETPDGIGNLDAVTEELERGEALVMELKIAIAVREAQAALKERLRADYLKVANAATEADASTVAAMTALDCLRADIEAIETDSESLKARLAEISNHVGELHVRASTYAEAAKARTKEAELESRLKEASKEVELYEYLVSEFGPRGIKSRILAKIATPLEAHCNEVLHNLTGAIYTLRFDFSDGLQILVETENGWVNADLLSSSERLRLGIVFQDIVNKRYNARLLVIDDVELLDDNNRNLLLSLLSRVKDDYDTIILSATGDPADWANPDVAVFHVVKGSVSRVA